MSPKPPFTKGFFPRLKTRATDPVSQTEPSPSSPSTSLPEAADRPANRPSAGHPPVIFLCELRAAACRREEHNQQDAQQRRLRRPRQKQADASQLLHQPPPNYLKQRRSPKNRPERSKKNVKQITMESRSKNQLKPTACCAFLFLLQATVTLTAGGRRQRRRRRSRSTGSQPCRWRVSPRATSGGGAWEDAPPLILPPSTFPPLFPSTVPADSSKFRMF